MPLLVMMRHGQSMWNKKNLFTGWVDVPLSAQGVEEALKGGKAIAHIPFDIAFISTLSRAENTAMIALSQHDAGKTPVLMHSGEGVLEEWGFIDSEKAKENTIPVYRSSALNERMYGALQGHNKDDMRAKYGKEQVHIWRRSFDVAPPKGESLKMTSERTLPYFENEIVPHLAEGKNVFISAHGNSMRAIVMKLDNLSPEEVVQLEIATGDPIIYEYGDGSFRRMEIDEANLSR